ncbi:hypothetical protein F5Y19DRAFT_31896 [Xylariaceae sp. FL1651]|nr:hypothetical protein F5Y19DRAFT_31896 [Xylariaceae sp. FL1651]
MAATLPSPRDLLTSLISSLPAIPAPDQAATPTLPSHKVANQAASGGASSPGNPLRLVPPVYRPLLTTLHVLYPSTLLPALDLLDRRLVTRVTLNENHPHAHEHYSIAGTSLSHDASAAEDIAEPHDNNNNKKKKRKPLYHLVRSAQPQSNRRHHHHHRSSSTTTPSGQVYVVRLDAWNCTCAAFAFSAFPPQPGSSGYRIFPATSARELRMQQGNTSERDGNEGEAWEFGGLSADGRVEERTGGMGMGSGVALGVGGGGGVPCCKHLLACVLAERWNGMLGGYVEVRIVGREEGAGLVGDL